MKSKTYNQTHLLIFLFVIFCFAKLAIVKQIPLINDEAYTLTISKYFSLSYFDHPPLMMWISYFLYLFEIIDFYIYRLPHIAFGILTSFFLYKIASRVYSREAGITSAILYFISPFFFFSGGLFIVPDASLNFAVVGATYIAMRIIFNNEDNIFLWISLGLLLSLAFLSKYQAYLFSVALFVTFIIWKRDIIFTKKFGLSLFISLFGLVPVFLWNMENNFSSFTFHGNRSSFNFDPIHALSSLFAQFFFLLPTTGFLIVLGLIKKNKLRTNCENFLLLLAFPIIVLFNSFILTSENSFSHWAMVGWLLLIPTASNYFVSMKSFKAYLITLKILNFFLIFSLISIVLIHAKTGFITKSYKGKIPKWDNTRELLDWGSIAKALTKNLSEGELGSLATLNWYDSGQLMSAFKYERSVGVVGPNSNHFEYIDLKDKDFNTLIDIRLINNNENFEVTNKSLNYKYNIFNRRELPYFRGNQRYGTIYILSIEKVN